MLLVEIINNFLLAFERPMHHFNKLNQLQIYQVWIISWNFATENDLILLIFFDGVNLRL